MFFYVYMQFFLIRLIRWLNDFIEKYGEASELAEDYADQMHEQITHYLIKCESLQVTEKQLNHISNMIQIVDELENMSDSCYGTIMLIIRSIEKKMKFDQIIFKQACASIAVNCGPGTFGLLFIEK